MKKTNVKKIQHLLEEYAKFMQSINTPTTKEGALDMDKLQTLPATITLIENLKNEGVNNRHMLAKVGFPAASLIFRF